MDKVEKYRGIIREVLQGYAAWKPRDETVRSELIQDRENDYYLLKYVGWQRGHRINVTIAHLDIIDGKVWIQFDGSNYPVARELVAAGIPKSDIVLGEQPPSVRPDTGYGIG